jgi:hypothetical protein
VEYSRKISRRGTLGFGKRRKPQTTRSFSLISAIADIEKLINLKKIGYMKRAYRMRRAQSDIQIQ